MSTQPLNDVLESLRERLAEEAAQLIMDVRIALTPGEARLIEFKQAPPLATISY